MLKESSNTANEINWVFKGGNEFNKVEMKYYEPEECLTKPVRLLKKTNKYGRTTQI